MEEDKISAKDIPSYHWPTKEEGKAQYPKFAKDFQGTLKGLRIVVEPGGIDRYLGPLPGRRPNNADERAEWLAKSNNYQTKLDKVEMFCATALGVLEKSFPYGTTPRNIIDKASEKPVDVPLANWTYRRRFEACWEALKVEYQPSTSVDLKQLKDQLSKLTDEGPGGFENFQSEFHRLHAEIMATGVDDAVTERELNDIVRDGIKNQFIWVNVCYNLYRDNPNAPWRNTFTAVATALIPTLKQTLDRLSTPTRQYLPIPPTPFLINKVNSIIKDQVILLETTPEDFRNKLRRPQARLQAQTDLTAPAPATHPVLLCLEKPPIDAPDAGKKIPIRTKCVLKLNVRVVDPYSQVRSSVSIMIIIHLP